MSETALDNSGNGFSPGRDIAPWPWWQDKFIIQKKDPFHAEQKTVAAAGDGSTAIWRFLAVDEGEGYFKTRETEPGKSDCGPIQAFIEKYIRLLELDRGRRDAGSFEITQAIDADGNPIFVPLPYDNSMLIPVLELRFKSTADIQPGRAYSVRLQLLDDMRPPFANEFGIEIDLTINVPWPRSGDGAGRTAGAQGETAVMAPDLDGAEDMLAPQSSPLSIDIL